MTEFAFVQYKQHKIKTPKNNENTSTTIKN